MAVCWRRFCSPLWDGLPSTVSASGQRCPSPQQAAYSHHTASHLRQPPELCFSEGAIKNKQTYKWLFLHLHVYKQRVSCKISVHVFALWLPGRPKQLVVTALEALRQQSQLPMALCFAAFRDLPAQVCCNRPKKMPSSGARNYLLSNSS